MIQLSNCRLYIGREKKIIYIKSILRVNKLFNFYFSVCIRKIFEHFIKKPKIIDLIRKFSIFLDIYILY